MLTNQINKMWASTSIQIPGLDHLLVVWRTKANSANNGDTISHTDCPDVYEHKSPPFKKYLDHCVFCFESGAP
jgi:hypothetical protein